MHADYVDIDQPDEDAYGRVTNPERYQLVVDATQALIDELVATYEVEAETGKVQDDFPNWKGPAVKVTRLRPREGAPLVFLFTGFPGVVVRVGEWTVQAFPTCGCDACNEDPPEVVRRLTELVHAAVEGRYTEELTKRRLSYSPADDSGGSSSEHRLYRGEWTQ